MAESFLVPWTIDSRLNEFVFASNTTIITENVIVKAMNDLNNKSDDIQQIFE